MLTLTNKIQIALKQPNRKNKRRMLENLAKEYKSEDATLQLAEALEQVRLSDFWCCSGRECGCAGITNKEYEAH